tara:strand:+ start:817 stop:1332 length:516 start_codon:yes stop_codon:yes gene_type:complete
MNPNHFSDKLENAFSSLEDFTKYMDSFKQAIKIDKKLGLVMSMMIQNIVSTFIEGIEIAVKNGHLAKPYALIQIHRFATVQKQSGSLGHVFDMNLNITSVARECGIIPEGMFIVEGSDSHPQGEFGMALAVEEGADMELIKEVTKEFEDFAKSSELIEMQSPQDLTNTAKA